MIIGQLIENWPDCFADVFETAPWEVTARLPFLIEQIVRDLSPDEFDIADHIAIHKTAVVEQGSIIKAPAVIGANCFVASGAYVRGGVWLGNDCILGPGCELKTTIMLAGSKLAHFNFVGDSVIGAQVNLEAGSIIANYRNEAEDKIITICRELDIYETGVEKFGAIIGDHVRIGSNAVVAPGAILEPGSVVPRLALVDQSKRP